MAAQVPVNRPYFHNGHALSSPPLTARIHRFLDTAYMFLGLYLVTLFSFDTQAAAQTSSFNPRNRSSTARSSSSSKTTGKKPPGSGWNFFGGGGGGGGGGPGTGGNGGGGAGKRMGGVDDIRGPECKSCG